MSRFLTDLADANPEWLTALLREQGVLPGGEVIQIDHLYLALAGNSGDLPIVRCYDARYVSGRPDRFQLLLDDPSATTHVAFPYSAVPPTLSQCEQIVDTLAKVHARFWDDLTLGDQLEAARPAELHSAAVSNAFVVWADDTLPRFLADLGERLPVERKALYTHIGAATPARLLERHATGARLTLTQGDVHLGNFLYPRDPATEQAYIIDWKRAGFTIGANDLAYMMALYWFPAVRAQWEQPLLRRYHACLLAFGVAGYSWDDLWNDYRLCVFRQFFEAVWGWSARQNSTIWWNHLERVTLAIGDLRCLEVV